jgi:hypothetical protein
MAKRTEAELSEHSRYHLDQIIRLKDNRLSIISGDLEVITDSEPAVSFHFSLI